MGTPDQTLVIAVLVGAIILLIGLLILLAAAALAMLLLQRRAAQRRRRSIRMPPRSGPPLNTPSPTPVSRVVGPPPFIEEFDPASADEVATEVMTSEHLQHFLDEDTETGTTEVRGPNPLAGELTLDDTEETTAIGRRMGRVVAEDE
jgi:hypothetical protein